MAANAIYVKTESGDDYLYCETVEFTTESFIEYLKENLGEEFAYIGDFSLVSVDYECKVDDEIVWDAISEAEE